VAYPVRTYGGNVQADLAAPEHEVLVDHEDLEDTETFHIPPYHVILFDDDSHTYEYVIEMLIDTFGHSMERAFTMARKVDAAGWVVVDTTTRERAELKRDQIHAYGADWRIETCTGSMSATVEKAE
jgi:ATP-dependent Clp protease adaptor protein ClpS